MPAVLHRSNRRRSAARLRVWTCVLLLALAGAESARCQPGAGRRPRVGLVLSGGGAKGLAHIGVLRELLRAGIPIDVVTGTSMGSLVGGLYAIGYGPDEIEHVAAVQDWEALFSDAAAPRALSMDGLWLDSRTRFPFPVRNGRFGLPTGVVRGQRIWQLLAGLSSRVLGVDDFRRFPIPFTAVATDIETGDPVVLDRGFLADALRASMSLPAVFSPFQLNGRLLVDGGLVRNLPSQEARALGADVLVCSDVSDPLLKGSEIQSFVDVLLQTVSFQMEKSNVQQRQLCDAVISPDIKGLSSAAFDKVGPWVARGTMAAVRSMDDVKRVTAAARQAATPPDAGAPDTPAEMPRIDAVRVEGGSPEGQKIARRIVDRRLVLPIAQLQLDRVVTELYDTGLFERVTYGVTGDDAQRVLVVRLVDTVEDSYSLGFRYDSRYKASLLFSPTFRNQVRFGSASRFELRAGEQSVVYGQYMDRAGVASHLVLGVDAGYVRTPIDVFAGDTRVAQARATVLSASAFVGMAVRSLGLARLQVKGEHAVNETSVAPVDQRRKQNYYTVAATLSRQESDRPAYPSRGASLYAKVEAASHWMGSGADFWHTVVDASAAVPVTRGVTVQARATAGAAGGEDLPVHYHFFLGGINTSAVFCDRQMPFSGLRAQQRFGRSVQVGRLGVQVQLPRRLFATLHADAGNTFDARRFDPGSYRTGFGLSLGTPTVLGPLEVSMGTRDFSHATRVEFHLGFPF